MLEFKIKAYSQICMHLRYFFHNIIIYSIIIYAYHFHCEAAAAVAVALKVIYKTIDVIIVCCFFHLLLLLQEKE